MPGVHDVTQDQAKRMLENYKLVHGKVDGFKYEKAKIQAILNQAGCTHLRIYYGYDMASGPSGATVKKTQIIVGVDSANKDLGTNDLTKMAEYGQDSVDQSSAIYPSE